MDLPLRNKMWDVITLHLEGSSERMTYASRRDNYYLIWTEFFEEAADRVPDMTLTADGTLRKFFFEAEWHAAYDLVDYVVCHCDRRPGLSKDSVIKLANEYLEKYLAGYRFVGGSLAPVVEEFEIRAIEDALSTPLNGVKGHLKKSLDHLSDRQNPDPANSIKESISAVESTCSAITGKRATLGEALNALEKSGVTLHPALVKGWKAIYGYTSDAAGIRHAMQDDAGVDVDDALYFLVSCSSFINLLVNRATQAGLTLQPAK